MPDTNISISVWFCFVSFFYYFGTVYVDLVVMSFLINLPYIILLWFTLMIFFHKILTFCFKPTVEIVKNILCNGFKRNVNAIN